MSAGAPPPPPPIGLSSLPRREVGEADLAEAFHKGDAAGQPPKETNSIDAPHCFEPRTCSDALSAYETLSPAGNAGLKFGDAETAGFRSSDSSVGILNGSRRDLRVV